MDKLQSGRTESVWGQDSGDSFPKLLSFGKSSCYIEISGNNITFHAPKGTYTAVFAAYDISGKLLQAATESITIGETGTAELTLEHYLKENGAKTKVMLWDSLSGMKPVCSVKTVNNYKI